MMVWTISIYKKNMTYSNRRMKLLSTSFEILAETDADANEKHKLFVRNFTQIYLLFDLIGEIDG